MAINKKRFSPAFFLYDQKPCRDYSNKHHERRKKRCRDYDEKGFCMRGDLCQYDHGKDPVVLDGSVESVLGLTNNGANVIGGSGGGSNLSTSSNTNYLPEPYNPETPGIDPGIAIGHIQRRQQQLRPRELVGVPVTNDDNHQLINNQQQQTENLVESSIKTSSHSQLSNNNNSNINNNNNKRQRKNIQGLTHGNYNRGFNKRREDNQDKCTLEVKKIPANLNTITNLNSHFSKFGTIVNLQVCFENNPESALIQFASHQQALAAYRCTEAVLNNRFIKVFWHSNEKNDDQQQQTNQMNINQDINQQQQQNKNNQQSLPSHNQHKSLSITNPILSRRMNLPPTSRQRQEQTQQQQQQQPHKVIPRVKTDIKTVMKDNLVKKLEVNKRRRAILEQLLAQQKLMFEILNKANNDKDSEKAAKIKDELDSVSKQIKVLEDDLKKDTQVILEKAQSKPTLISGNLRKPGGNVGNVTSSNLNNEQPVKNLSQIEKELLDAEMDYHNKLHKGEVTSDIFRRLNELRLSVRQAKFAESKKLNLKNKLTRSGLISNRGRMHVGGIVSGLLTNRNPIGGGYGNSRKLDHRTKKICFYGIKEDDNNEVLKQLTNFSNIESIENNVDEIMICFKSRMDAEIAWQHLPQLKLKDDCIKYRWFEEGLTGQHQTFNDIVSCSSSSSKTLLSSSKEEEANDIIGVNNNSSTDKEICLKRSHSSNKINISNNLNDNNNGIDNGNDNNDKRDNNNGDSNDSSGGSGYHKRQKIDDTNTRMNDDNNIKEVDKKNHEEDVTRTVDEEIDLLLNFNEEGIDDFLDGEDSEDEDESRAWRR